MGLFLIQMCFVALPVLFFFTTNCNVNRKRKTCHVQRVIDNELDRGKATTAFVLFYVIIMLVPPINLPWSSHWSIVNRPEGYISFSP